MIYNERSTGDMDHSLLLQDSKNWPMTTYKKDIRETVKLYTSLVCRTHLVYHSTYFFCENANVLQWITCCTNRDQHASRLKPRAAASEEGDDECDASRGEQ